MHRLSRRKTGCGSNNIQDSRLCQLLVSGKMNLSQNGPPIPTQSTRPALSLYLRQVEYYGQTWTESAFSSHLHLLHTDCTRSSPIIATDSRFRLRSPCHAPSPSPGWGSGFILWGWIYEGREMGLESLGSSTCLSVLPACSPYKNVGPTFVLCGFCPYFFLFLPPSAQGFLILPIPARPFRSRPQT